jgi:hypothetical protein
MKPELEPPFLRRSVTNAKPVRFSHNRAELAMIRLSIFLPWDAQSLGVGRKVQTLELRKKRVPKNCKFPRKKVNSLGPLGWLAR